MSSKTRVMLHDFLISVYFGFCGIIFLKWDAGVFALGQSALLLTAFAIRPREYRIGIARVVVLSLVTVVTPVGAMIVACRLGVYTTHVTLWPGWLKMIVSTCLVSAAIVHMSKLREDWRFAKREGT